MQDNEKLKKILLFTYRTICYIICISILTEIKMTKIQERRKNNRAAVFREGLRDGMPIALGYFAVAFSLGIAARNAGLTAFQGFLAAGLTNASAGGYAAFLLIGANASYLEMALMTLVANARYLLMSCALSQKFSPETSLFHRLLVGFDVTDEIFGITIARKGALDPLYNYGAMTVAIPGWALGTALGVIAGNIMPLRAVSALSVALYGMFLAIIIPPAKENRVLAALIPVCFALSFASEKLPYISGISSGTRTIILTVALSAVAAAFFPHETEDEDEA